MQGAHFHSKIKIVSKIYLPENLIPGPGQVDIYRKLMYERSTLRSSRASHLPGMFHVKQIPDAFVGKPVAGGYPCGPDITMHEMFRAG